MGKKTDYKQVNLPWCPEIPNDWDVVKLSYDFLKIGSGTTPQAGNPLYYQDGTFNWLQTGDLDDGLITQTSKKVTQKALDDYPTLRFYSVGSLVIAMYGATIGKSGILGIETTTNQACCVLAEPNRFDTKFIYYWFHSNKLNIISLSYGGGQPNISQELIRNLRVQCPPMELQRKITNFLDQKTAEIDNLILKKQNLINCLIEEEKSTINDAITKGIDKSAELRPSNVEWLGDIPKDWEIKKLKYVAQVNPTKKNFQFDKDDENEVIFLPMEKVKENGNLSQDTVKSIKELSKGYTYFERNDIIVAKITPCFENGKAANLSDLKSSFGFGSTEFHTLRATEKIIPEFIFNIIKSERFMKIGEASMTGSAGQKRVPTDFLKEFHIALPPLEMQESIVSFIKNRVHFIRTTIEKIETEIDLLDEYRISLINEVVTGKTTMK